jgi:hypothetical protein
MPDYGPTVVIEAWIMPAEMPSELWAFGHFPAVMH